MTASLSAGVLQVSSGPEAATVGAQHSTAASSAASHTAAGPTESEHTCFQHTLAKLQHCTVLHCTALMTHKPHASLPGDFAQNTLFPYGPL